MVAAGLQEPSISRTVARLVRRSARKILALPPRCVGVERVGRGHAKNDPHHNREPVAFAVAVAEVFDFREDWHQDDRAIPLVRQYQLTLDAVLRRHPDLRDCAVRCRQCGIRFFTHPRNAGRRDLRCPFGCRPHHRRQRGNARSRRHYQTVEGRRNKKRLNGQRGTAGKDAQSTAPPERDLPPSPVGRPTLEQPSDARIRPISGPERGSELATPHAIPPTSLEHANLLENAAFAWEGLLLDEATVWNSPVLPHVLMVASVIEGRTIHRAELLAALRNTMRQRSIGRWPRREYVVRYLNHHPP